MINLQLIKNSLLIRFPIFKLFIDSLEIKGRGGTNFDAAVSAFTSKSKIKIIFTDGYANMPQKSVDAIWIVYSELKINLPGGVVININTDEILNYERSIIR